MMPQPYRLDLDRYRQGAEALMKDLRVAHPTLDIRINPFGSVLPTEGGAYVECVVFVRDARDGSGQ